MEALNFLKFWRPTALTTTTIPTGISSPIIEIEEEEEDSFFDLELSVSDFTGEKQSNKETHLSGDVFSKRKIIPIEPSPPSSSSKPQSPISVLKSAPKFRVFKKTQKTEEAKNRDNGVEKAKLEMKRSSGDESAICDASASKRFAKDAIQRYLKLIVKSSKKNGEKSKLCAALSMASPSASPATQSRNRVSKKSFGKSKSASASVGIESPARRDDSLLQQNDGIQSAILHCKRSFNSSRESSMLSRSSSDSIKSISSSDCSVLSRYSSDKWIDSARSSSEGGSVSL